jgi:hypothetical protein
MGQIGMRALEMQTRLRALQAERTLVSTDRWPTDSAYLADLEEEIAETRAAYVEAAVTEMATLRSELFGPQVG